MVVLGKLYTGISWFLGKDNPPDSKCKKARTRCASNALVLSGGHTRALDKEGFAASPSAGAALKELCPKRKRLGEKFVPTEVEGVEIARASLPLKARLSQVLFLVEDLEACFAK